MKKICLGIIILFCCFVITGCNNKTLKVQSSSMEPVIKVNDEITYEKVDYKTLKEQDIIIYNYTTITYYNTEDEETKIASGTRWTDDGINFTIIDDSNYLEFGLKREEKTVMLITRILSIREENNKKVFLVREDKSPLLDGIEITEDVVLGKVIKVNNKRIG